MYTGHWVYESLVDVEPDLATPVARLAESWTPEEEGRIWVFNLRRGVKWHHGREFVADDVLATFEKILNPDFGASAAEVFASITDMDKPDDYTVRFTLKVPNADFPIMHSYFTARIVPHDLTDDQIESEPRGTGPFRIDNYAHADRISFYRNEGYWMEGLPYLDEVEFVSIPEPTTLANALQAGEVDIYFLPSSQVVTMLKDDPNIVLAATVPISQHMIYMKLTDPPFNDDRVRRAFKLIGDHAAMAQAALPGIPTVVVDDNPVLTTSAYHIETQIWKQDIAEAKRLLTDAGYGNGLEVTLWAINDIPGFLEMSLTFAEWAKQAGITVKVEGVKADSYYAEKWMVEPFGTVEWWCKATRDQELRIPYFCGADWNETKFCNPEFDRLLNEALGEIDDVKRTEMYAQAQRILIEQGGQIIPYHAPLLSLARKNVRGHVPHPAAGLEPRQVWLA
jgi:peptide/nickel transport system substrate-binding protein